jgi:lipopolysaccharide biosynthesis regulator YciM
MMDLTTIIAVAAIIIILLFVVFVGFRRRAKEKVEARAEYIAGLNYLIDGDKERALEKFKSTVRMNTEFIDAYIKIGDIFRQLKTTDKAVKVHRDLLVRPNLKQRDRIAIIKSLATDYYELKQYPNALQACKELLSMQRHNAWAKDFEIKIYESMKDWQAAFDAVKKDNQLPHSEQKQRMASYKVEIGRQLIEIEREHDARLRFREAIRIDAEYVPSYLELADSYIREKREKDALSVLERFIKTNPHSSGMAFARLKQVLFDLGHFGDIEKIYVELSTKNPEVIEGLIGLAEIYEKKGEIHKAIDAANKALAVNPNRLDTKLLLLKLNSKLGRDKIASEIITDLVNEFLKREKPG